MVITLDFETLKSKNASSNLAERYYLVRLFLIVRERQRLLQFTELIGCLHDLHYTCLTLLLRYYAAFNVLISKISMILFDCLEIVSARNFARLFGHRVLPMLVLGFMTFEKNGSIFKKNGYTIGEGQ